MSPPIQPGSVESPTDSGPENVGHGAQPHTVVHAVTPSEPADDAKGEAPLPNNRRRRLSMAGADSAVLAPMRGLGDFFALSLDTFVAMFRRPFAWRELLEQSWFVARVSLVPSMVLSIPYVVLSVFTFNVLLVEFGAADLSGTGASVTGVNEIGPFVTVLVVAGSGAAAICADLGARTIREELDALRVMGVDPVQALMAPRVIAITVVSWLISSLVTLTGLVGGFFFSVFFQHVTPGAFVAGLTLITGLPDVVVSMVKATLFGLTAGLIGVYLGSTVKGGPAGVGNAVNQTVVLSFVSLFVINLILTAVGFEVTK